MGRRLLIIVSVVFVVVAGIYFLASGGDLRQVKLVAVERGEIKSAIRVTGRVINDKTVTMTALVNGQIDGMLVQKGDTVKADQVLAFFDGREADAKLAKTAAVLAREEQAVIESREKYGRLKNVKLSGGSSQQIIDDAEAMLKAAITRRQVAKADLNVARIQREKIQVRAPFAGVITEKTTEKGQWLEAGTKLFTLVGIEGREIEVKVDAGDSGAIKIGQVVDLTCDAYPGLVWQEKIHWIAPSIIQDESSDAVNTFSVRISLSPQAPKLLLGQQVDAHIVLNYKPDVRRLPYAAIQGDVNNYSVFILENDVVKLKTIKTGLEDDRYIEIIEGLVEGDQVVLTEGKPIKENQTVQVIE